MQPYFFPYAGYFRLFAAADVFVVYDCVQFPRRGWVHRNQLLDECGQARWLTLPLRKGDRDTTRIADLAFRSDARDAFFEQCGSFPAIKKISEGGGALFREIGDFDRSPVQYLVKTMQAVSEMLGISRPVVLSSELGIPAELRAQDRIITIAKRLGAERYINAPGGRALYEPKEFDRAGLQLGFLADYSGPHQSILQRLAFEPAADLAEEIQRTATVDWCSRAPS